MPPATLQQAGRVASDEAERVVKVATNGAGLRSRKDKKAAAHALVDA